MKIGVDIDDVVLDSMDGYLKEWKKKFGNSIEIKDVSDYNFWNLFGGTSNKQARDFFDEFFEEKAYALDFIEGAKESINYLLKNHQIFFVTSRPNIYKEDTDNFFKKHFPNENINIIYVDMNLFNHNNFNHEGKTKADICLNLKLDFLIEDHEKYATGCSDSGIKVLLLDKPWNQDVEEHKNINRVKNWKEILEKLK